MGVRVRGEEGEVEIEYGCRGVRVMGGGGGGMGRG